MFEKNLQIGFLLDFYGDILSERKRTVMDMYYNEDLSLAEIAAEIGISRQGVRDLIKKSEEELKFYEEKLGLAEKLRKTETHAKSLLSLADKLSLPEEFTTELKELTEIISE
ncbi:MAG: DNA-binding protein [Ruminococcaceae bacterium]|nr:DNA-binding protein [Oscillospiraceae bacterium]